MLPLHQTVSGGLTYRPGLDRLEEAIISSHFMHELCRDTRLELYDEAAYSARFVAITESALDEALIPALLAAARSFALQRAQAARIRAAQRRADYGLGATQAPGVAECITEVVFDPQFRSGSRETVSRLDLCRKVAQRVAAGQPIDMAIPALPYKFSCPLKTRGQRPDLAEVNFILGLYEIVLAVETIYQEAHPALRRPLARFTVVSDGGRFSGLTNEPEAVLHAYQQGLRRWIGRLRLGEYVELLDYRALLRERLPPAAQHSKRAQGERARLQYEAVMWRCFDAGNMAASLSAAARHEPDPEARHPEGRFVSLLKSLVYTVKYRSLDRFSALPPEPFRQLYRELTGHLFEPFAGLSDAALRLPAAHGGSAAGIPCTPAAKEQLRQEMLREVWQATMAYVAEIRSDRDQPQDPISLCLPQHLRWTIHAKPGQLGLLTPSAFGKTVQAWAGAAVFKRSGQEGIRLCTMPVLALEGAGAVPVGYADVYGEAGPGQPLFYIYPDVAFAGIEGFIAELGPRMLRRRAR